MDCTCPYCLMTAGLIHPYQTYLFDWRGDGLTDEQARLVVWDFQLARQRKTLQLTNGL